MQKAGRAKKQRQPNEMNKENHFTTVCDEISAQKLCAGMMPEWIWACWAGGLYGATSIQSDAHGLRCYYLLSNLYCTAKNETIHQKIGFCTEKLIFFKLPRGISLAILR